MNFLPDILHGVGPYLTLGIALVLCGVGNPIPEDLVLMTAGYLISSAQLEHWPTMIVCYIGVIVGDLLLYMLGFHYGQRIIGHPRIARLAPPERVARIRHNFQRWGRWSIAFARFLPGLRAPTFLLAGVMHVRWQTFALLDGIGGLLSVPLFVGLGMFFGGSIETLGKDFRTFSHWAIGVLAVLVAGWFLWRYLRSNRATAPTELP